MQSTYFICVNVRAHWAVLFPLVLQSLSDSDDSLRFSACKVLEEFTATSSEKDTPQNSKYILSCLHEDISLWSSILEDKRVIVCFKDHYHNVRASICSCLANMNESTFSLLSVFFIYLLTLQPELQKKTMQSIIQLISDNSPLVRTNACRALGVVILFPSSYNDISFVSGRSFFLNADKLRNSSSFVHQYRR